MAGKKRSSSKKALKAEVEELRVRAEKAEARRDKWKARARRVEKDAVELRRDLRRTTKRLVEAAQNPATTPPPEQPVGQRAVEETDRRPDQPERPQPDASWTVVRLRAEAKARGLPGSTTKSKEQLLALLRAE